MLRLYTGPMYKKYNGLLREFLRKTNGCLLPSKERSSAEVREAMKRASRDLGNQYVTSILVLVSALQKLRLVNPLPAGRKVYRGLAGLKVPDRFKDNDSRGNRGGVEFGFLSTSISKQEAIGYINVDKGMPQLYEIEVGQIDRGADVSWISYFPVEKEVLLPPLCSLEATGDPRYDEMAVTGHAKSDKSVAGAAPQAVKVMVWPVRLNVNLRGRTIDEHQGIRKTLFTRMAEQALSEVEALLAAPVLDGQEDAAGCQALKTKISSQCQLHVNSDLSKPDSYFNDDNAYSTAIQGALHLKPWAEGLLKLHSTRWFSASELQKLDLTGHLPSLQAAERSLVCAGMAARSVCERQNLFSHREQPALTLYAEAGKPEEVARLLHCSLGSSETAASDSVNVQNSQGDSALLLACSNGHREVAKLLLSWNADPNLENKERETPIMKACQHGHEGLAQDLLDDEDCEDLNLNAMSTAGFTPLILACKAGLKRVAINMIGMEAFVDARTDDGKTPLMMASEQGLGEVAELLLQKRADVHAHDKSGNTALMRACSCGQENVAMMLVDNDISQLRAVNSAQQTPLWNACAAGLETASLSMIALRADPFAKDSTGLTPLAVACFSGHDKLAAAVLQKMIIWDDGGDPENIVRGKCVQCGEDVTIFQRRVRHANGAYEHEMDPWTKLCLTDTNAPVSAPQSNLPATVSLAVVQEEEQANDDMSHSAGIAQDATLPDTPQPPTPPPRQADSGRQKVRMELAAQDGLGWRPLDHACARRLIEVARLMVEAGANVNEPDKSGSTPLLKACEAGCAEVATLLLENDANFNTADFMGRTPLLMACTVGLPQLAKELLDRGAQADRRVMNVFKGTCQNCKQPVTSLQARLRNQQDGYEHRHDETEQCKLDHVFAFAGCTALFIACEQGHEEVAKLMLDRGNEVNAQDDYGTTPLMRACKKGHLEVAKLLLCAGAETNLLGTTGFTALHVASEHGHGAVVRLLLENDANVDVRRHGGLTPLMLACTQGHLAVSRTLLENKAEPCACGFRGETALSIACTNGHTDIVGLLVDKIHELDKTVGNVNQRCNIEPRGDCAVCGLPVTSSHLRTRRSDNKYVHHVDPSTNKCVVFAEVQPMDLGMALMNAADCKTAAVLVDRGVDVNFRGLDGRTALFRACKSDQLDLGKLLVDNGASVTVQDNQGFDPLMIASRSGSERVASLLLEHGAQPDVQCRRLGGTALHLAAGCGSTDIASLLADRGADLNATDKEGRTAFMVACDCKHEDLAAMLLNRGADTHTPDGKGRSGLHWANLNNLRRVVSMLAPSRKKRVLRSSGSFKGFPSPGSPKQDTVELGSEPRSKRCGEEA